MQSPAPLVFMGLIGPNSHNPEETRLVACLAERGHPIVYLAPLGIRDPGPHEWLNGLRRLRRARVPKLTSGGVRSAALIVLPWRYWEPVARINRCLVRWQLGRAMRGLGGQSPILWLRLPTPELVMQLEELGARGVVYECIDDYSAYPHYQPAELRRLDRAERQLAARADLLITLSEAVASRFPEAAKRTHVVPLGADLACFRRSTGDVPLDLARLPQPRLGLVGGLDERVDFDLLRTIALAEPSWHVVLIGPGIDQLGMRVVAEVPNVYLLGPRPHRQVPDYLRGLDVLLIPYRRTAWTDGCLPAKLLEYLADGHPVVATALPGLALYADVIELASDAHQFVVACRRALAERHSDVADRRRAVAAGASLDRRCDVLDDLLSTLPAR